MTPFLFKIKLLKTLDYGGFGGYGDGSNANNFWGNNEGGFLNNGTKPGFSGTQEGANGGATGARRWNDAGVRPMTIRQLNHCTVSEGEDGRPLLQFEGYSVHGFTLVAKVLRKDQQATSMSYQLFDGTGSMNVRLFVNGNEDNKLMEERQECDEGRYVRLYGTCSSRDNRKLFVGRSIKCITDFNEITHHHLEVMYAHFYSANGPLKDGATESAIASATNNSAPTAAPSHIVAGAGGMNPLQSKIAQIIQKYSGSSGATGVSIKSIVSGLHGISDEQSIRNACNFMLEEGYIYETSENDTYLLAV